MQIVPAIDLKSGLIVRAVAGRRDQYRPIESQLAPGARPESIGAALLKLGMRQVYVADLDSIEGKRAPDWKALRALADAGLSLWIDVGISSRSDADRLVEFSEDQPQIDGLIVALESIPDLDTMSECLDVIGPDRFIFSLDIKGGAVLTRSDDLQQCSPLDVAGQVSRLDVRRMTVLDLASVGVGAGCPTLQLCESIIERHSDIEVITGGGIRDVEDLKRVQRAGCSAALVSSALHDGLITAEDMRAFAIQSSR
jgi:phosphoribosylformimino-5-aminoimidazole carboxamide ribotide isomerase